MLFKRKTQQLIEMFILGGKLKLFEATFTIQQSKAS